MFTKKKQNICPKSSFDARKSSETSNLMVVSGGKFYLVGTFGKSNIKKISNTRENGIIYNLKMKI